MFKCFIEPALLLQRKVHLPSKSYSYRCNSIKTAGWGSLWAFININHMAPVLTDHTWNAVRCKKFLGWDVASPSAVLWPWQHQQQLDCAAQRTSPAWMAAGVCVAEIWGRFGLCVGFRRVKCISQFEIYLREALTDTPDKEIPIFFLLTSLHEERQMHPQFKPLPDTFWMPPACKCCRRSELSYGIVCKILLLIWGVVKATHQPQRHGGKAGVTQGRFVPSQTLPRDSSSRWQDREAGDIKLHPS